MKIPMSHCHRRSRTQRLLAASLIAWIAVQAVIGPVAAVDNAGGSSVDRGQMAGDCAAAGGSYFDSVEGVEGGEHLYGCQHEDSVTLCDDRIAGGGCVNHVNEPQVRDTEPEEPAGPVWDHGGVVWDKPLKVLPSDGNPSRIPGQLDPAAPAAPRSS